MISFSGRGHGRAAKLQQSGDLYGARCGPPATLRARATSGVELPPPCRGPSSTGKFDGLKPQQFQTFSGVELRRRTFPVQVRRVSSTVLNPSNFKRFWASNLGVELPVYKDREKFDAFSLPLDLRI